MSTAMTLPGGVSAFYDVGDILFQERKNYQNQRNMHLTERRILGMGTQQMATSTPSGSGGMMGNGGRACSRSLSVTDAFAQQAQHFLNQNNQLATSSNGGGSPVLGRECHSPPTSISALNIPTSALSNLSSQNRRLDRSVSEPAGDRNAQLKNNVNTSRYKTELCRPFEESGHCKYGDKCQFAHGADELRSLSRHPKYKTELCRTFHTVGFCPYGPRCHFVHNDDLRRLNAVNQLKVSELQSQFQQQQQQHQQQQQQQHHQSWTSKLSSPPVGSQHVVSGPTPITRPKALSFSYSTPYVRDSLGSTADSPPSSITDSPTLSPTMLSDEYLCNGLSNMPMTFSPPPPTSGIQGTFTFPGEEILSSLQPTNTHQPPPMMTPLNIQTDLSQIQARLTAMCLNQRNNNHLTSMPTTQTPVSSTCSSSSEDFTLPLFPRDSTDINAPPSPPDSLSGDSAVSSTCEYPLDVSRGLRLPIFSQLSNRE